jgi:type IX secretion system protein PorV
MRDKMKTYYIKFIVLSCLLSSVSLGQNLFPLLGGQRKGTAAMTFLKIDVGAQATAMSGAAVAMANDASTLYWNPGAAAFVPKNYLTVSHIDWPVDIQYEYIGYIHHFPDIGSIGISFGMLHMEDMEVTTEYHPTGTGEYFRYFDTFSALTYSVKITERFSAGTSVKYVKEHLAGIEMGGWMIDLGTLYWTGYRSLRFAVSVVNFGDDLRPEGTYNKKTKEGGSTLEKYEEFSPPTTFRVGTAMDVYSSEKYEIVTSLQINHPVDNAENAVIGLEFGYMKYLFLRTGYRINYDEERFTFGAGFFVPIMVTNLALDYSFKDFNNLGSTHQFSLGFSF